MYPSRRLKYFTLLLVGMTLFATSVTADTAGVGESTAAPDESVAQRPSASRYLIDTGPLRIRDQFVLGMGFFAFDPVSADIVDPGDWQIDLILTVSNNFASSEVVQDFLEAREARAPLGVAELRALDAEDPAPGLFIVDAEQYRTALALRRGITDRFHLEVVVPVISYRGGFLDGTIEGFHDTFSLGQAGRLGVPRDDFFVYLGHEDRELVEDRATGTALGDIVVGGKLALVPESPSRSFRLALEGTVKLPTGDEDRLAGSGSLDAGIQLLGTRYFAKSCLHGSLGLAYLGAFDRLGIGSQLQLSGMLAYEVGLGEKTSALIQATVSQSPFDDLDLEELSALSTQVTLGLKRVIGRQVLFLGITENVRNFDNTADIGVHLGWTRLF